MTEEQPPEGTVGERIRMVLAERKMSQRQFAAVLAGEGATANSVENARRQLSSWVNDEHVPSAENARALADHLNAPIEWFTDDRGAGRISLAGALQELGDVVGLLSEQAEADRGRSEEAAQIVRNLDLRLANIEALIGQLLEGQLAGAAALGELLDRWSDAGGSQKGRSQ